tara:strand:- start:58 stop:777 length:720 start_codon:yes stop_codon:yes gene_type:complete
MPYPPQQEEQQFYDESIHAAGGGYGYDANPGDEPLFEGFGEEGVTDWEAIVEPWLPSGTNIEEWSEEYGMYITPYSYTGENIAKNQFGVQQEVLRNEAYTEMDSINNQAGRGGFVGSGAVDQDVDTLRNMTVLSNASQNLQLKSNITDMRSSWQSDLYSMLGTLAGMDAFDGENSSTTDTSTDTLDPSTDPNVPGGGGFGLCADENGDWIDCPPLDDPDDCEEGEVYVDGYCVTPSPFN